MEFDLVWDTVLKMTKQNHALCLLETEVIGTVYNSDDNTAMLISR